MTKIDALDSKTISSRRRALEKASGGPVFAISGVSRQGLPEVLRTLFAQIQEDRFEEPDDTPWQP